jgi:hypothetical protein
MLDLFWLLVKTMFREGLTVNVEPSLTVELLRHYPRALSCCLIGPPGVEFILLVPWKTLKSEPLQCVGAFALKRAPARLCLLNSL